MDDKRTKLGPTGPVRQVSSDAPAAAPPAAVSAVAAAADPLIGQTLAGRYRIERRLGAGGMGAVYLATHEVLEKQVALKVLHGELGRRPELVERFMQEAKAASRIRHENVIDISDFGTTPEGHVFFAMELLDGRDLHEEIARARLAGELLPWTRSKRIFLQICGALAAAHRHGIIHRDLKPENVYLIEFLGDPDFVKLLDFGIAKLTEVEGDGRKLTRTGMLFGTPEYMAPEQARGEPIDFRVDVYAMGCILFQLVTGRVPFEADNFMGVLTQHLTEPPPPAPAAVLDRIGAPRELAAVIERALAKDREHRYQTIDELANAARVACGEAAIAPGGSAAQRAAAEAAGASSSLSAAAASSSSPLAVAPAPAAVAPSGRVRTRWTGKLAVPAADEPPLRKRRSRLPLVAGAIALAGAAAAVTVVVRHGGSDDGEGGAGGAYIKERRDASSYMSVSGSGVPPTGSAPGSDGAAATAVATAAAAVAPPSPPPVSPPAPSSPPEEAPLPDRVTVTLDSQPRGAIVKDLISGVVFGPTPRTFPVTPGRKPRQYRLTLRGYDDAQIELVPDRAAIEHTEALVKRAGGTQAGSRPAGGKPDPGTPQIKRPPGTGPVTVPPPPEDDCPELPCLKADPTRKGGGAAAGGSDGA